MNMPQVEREALIALLRHVEARGGYVQIRLDTRHSVTLLKSGKLIAGPLNTARTTHANIDAWLASLNV